ncbi:hypothetical protein KKG58_02215 [Patescibacteria group bacterium]|nr:hypothetical protein [Patescibacteria group bacterium]
MSKILDYYFDNPEFKEEFLRATRKFFNRSRLGPGDNLKLEEGDEEKFNEWLLFDFRLKNKKTLLKDFYQRNPYNLSSFQLESYKDLQDNEYGVFEVLEVKIGEGLRLKNLKTEKAYWVKEYKGTFQAEEGELLINRVGKVGNHLELVGSNSYKLSEGSKHPLLGYLIAQPKLNPKTAREFFQWTEKIRNANRDSLKEKILDGGRCICDICGRKAKMAAMDYSKKTGDPIVICYNCNLRIRAHQDGISIKEAERRRKRIFEVSYLFQDIKMKRYFNIKGKRKFDSIEEANKILERIVDAWNNLSIKQRTDFEIIENKKLRKIYKNIPVDFSNL